MLSKKSLKTNTFLFISIFLFCQNCFCQELKSNFSDMSNPSNRNSMGPPEQFQPQEQAEQNIQADFDSYQNQNQNQNSNQNQNQINVSPNNSEQISQPNFNQINQTNPEPNNQNRQNSQNYPSYNNSENYQYRNYNQNNFYPNEQNYASFNRESRFRLNIQNAVLPQGLIIPVTLDTTIAPQKAQSGDYVQVHVAQNISAGGSSYLPGGSRITGELSSSTSGKFFHKENKLGINFMQIRLPNGYLIPLNAHLVGDLENYLNQDGLAHQQGLGSRLWNTGWRGGIGGSIGTVMGTALGALSGGGHGPNPCAFTGAAMAGGMGVIDSSLYHSGHVILLHSGTQMQIQLDSPVEIPGPRQGPGYF